MSREQALALLQRHQAHLASRDPAGLAANYTEDALVVSPMFAAVKGRQAIEQSFVVLFDIFPDWQMAFEDPLVDGSRAVMCSTVRATHVGSFMGLAGTGRRSEFSSVLVFDIRDGLFAHERRIYDFTGMLIQLGVLRGKPAI
jgi:predicted ester cyclase